MKKLTPDSNQIRQGDVLLVRRQDDIPVDSQPVEANDRLILKEGEATGHAHAFYRPLRVALSQTPSKKRHLRVVETAYLRHEEHREAPVAPGTYDLPIQVEWSDDLEPRPVQD